MIVSLIILVPLLIVALVIFFRSSPKHATQKSVNLYNTIIIHLAVMVCGFHTYRTYSVMINTNDSGWWPILSIIGSLFFFSVILILGVLIRNFIIFRKKS